MISEIVLGIVIVFLIVLIAFKEWRNEIHIKELEDKALSSNLTEYYHLKGGKKRSESSPITKQEDNEIMLGEIPFMDIPKDYKIQMEGDPETPLETRARPT